MQHETLSASSVYLISYYRMMDVSQMDSNLMRAARIRADVKKRGFLSSLKDVKLSFCRTSSRLDGHPPWMSGVATDWGVDHSLFLRNLPLDLRDVDLHNVPGSELGLE
jgi:hypothetical protein